MKRFALRLAMILGLLVFWQLISDFKLVNNFILPAPTAIVAGFFGLLADGRLFLDILISMQRVLAGFFIALIFAVPLGLFLGFNETAAYYFSPIINFLRPIPPISWIPLAILWFGLGNASAYFITAIASFFPIFINSMFGVSQIAKEHRDVARCFGATKRMILFDVIFPAALPSILEGMRIGLGVGWMSVVAAEMIAALSGLGYLIIINQQMLRTDYVMVGMATIGVIGLLMDALMKNIKKAVIKWNYNEQ